MRPLRDSINVTLDGCCDHREMLPGADLHRHVVENLAQADAKLKSPINDFFFAPSVNVKTLSVVFGKRSSHSIASHGPCYRRL
jgi:hypothetical protein